MRAHTRAHTDTLTPARNSRRGAAIVGRRRQDELSSVIVSGLVVEVALAQNLVQTAHDKPNLHNPNVKISTA